MIIQKLHENWRMCTVGTGEYIPAAVPGSVYNDLLTNGKMEDPYYRDNETKALALMEDDFEYVSRFDVEGELLACEQVMLHFDGIDTLADIRLNGTWIGTANNMHRIWEFPVKGLLRESENELKVVLHSPTKFIREQEEKEPIPGSGDAMRGFPYLRKAHCMFGWVERRGEERLRRFGQDDDRLSGLSCRVTLTDPDGQKKTWGHDEAMAGIVIEEPRLWWPNGYGEQLLYEMEVELLTDCGNAAAAVPEGQEILESRETAPEQNAADRQRAEECRDVIALETWKRRIGLRTVTMCTEKDEYGEQFCHVVNGVKIFAMGADYIPEDNILPRVTPERTRNLLLQAKNANHNCVRVWGGGHYPGDDFWDACDELGLLVWEDFMFACAVYDLTEEFEENIRAEFIDNIKRIRHHASLGLWCGNNEMESFMVPGSYWASKAKYTSDYIKMYEYILPRVVKEYDPDTFYWPSSPSSGGGFDDPGDENRGDVHYWNVWHGNRPFTAYRRFHFRYVSEFGFQSFPSLKTCETFTLPEDRNIFSYVMEKHQRNASANGKIMNYMQQTFLYPSDFDTLLYASQLLQAEAIRYGVEHFRGYRGRCMGTVVWQLNDCWPVASWSSIDYYGRWKALHYYEKRFFAPVMLSCEEEGLLSQKPDVNAQPYEVKKSIRLNVANETMKEVNVTALEVRVEGDELVLTADAYAKYVEIINEADDMLREDNYFDMNAGERRVKILKGKPEGLKVRSVFDIR